MSSSLCSLLQPPATFFLLGLNILLNTLFWNTLNLWSFLSVRDQVSHPYETRGRIIVLCILICKFLERRRRLNILNWMVSRIPNLLLIFSWMQIWFVAVVPERATFLRIYKQTGKLRFYIAFWWQYIIIYLVFSVFTYKPLASNRACVFSLWYLCFRPVYKIVSIDQVLMCSINFQFFLIAFQNKVEKHWG